MSRHDIVELLLNRTVRRKRTMKVKDETKPVSIMDANGSAKSIIDWGSKCGLDNDQKRSFEIIAGSSILTFFDDCYDNLDERINDGMSQRQTRNHEFLS